MPVVIQNILISVFLKPLGKLTNKISEKNKNIIFLIGFISLTLLQFADSSALIYVRYLILFMASCVFFGLMIIGGLTDNLKAVKFNIPLSICWYGISLFMFLSSIFVSFDYIAHFIIWAIVFPVMFIVWGNNTHIRFIKLIITGTEISFILFLIINFFLFEFNTSEYTGLFMNPNSNGAYTVAVFICSIIHILCEKNNIYSVIFPSIISGIAFANILYSSSRGSMLAAFISIFVILIIYTILHFKEIKKIILYKFIPISLSFVLLFAVIPTVFSFGYASMEFLQNTKIHRTIKINRAKIAGIEITEEDLDDEKFNALVGNNSALNSNNDIPATNNGVVNGIVNQFDMSGGVTNFSNGRIGLWKLYAKELSFLGNPTDKVLINDFGEEENRESHLTPLQFSYEFGFPTGILYLAFNIISGILSLIYAIKNKSFKYSIFPLAIAGGYVILSLLEVMMSPITRLIVTVYMLSQAIIMVKKQEDEKTQTSNIGSDTK